MFENGTIDAETMQEAINRMLSIIMEASKDMPDSVFKRYLDQKVPAERKCVYNLIADAFLSLRSFCLLMFDWDWSQASAVLRMGIEQVAAVSVMAFYPNLMDDFVALQKERNRYYSFTTEKERKDYIKAANIRGNQINSFLDYSWIKKQTPDHGFRRSQLIELAKLDELNGDIDNTLNAFSHGSISVFQLNNKAEGWDLLKRHSRRISLVACKLYDYLVYSSKQIAGEAVLSPLLTNTYLTFKSIYRSVGGKTVVRQ